MGSALNSLLSTLFPLLSFLYSLLSSLFSLFFFLKASLFCLLSPRSLSISQAAVRNTCVQRSNMCPCFRQAQRFKVLREARAITSFKTIGGAIALSRTSHFCSQDLGGATFCKTTVDVSFPSRTVKCLEHTQTSWFRMSFRGNLWKSEEIIAERVVQTNYDFAALPAGPPNLRTLPHTSAHFPHTFRTAGERTPMPAHFRTLSAHFPHDRGGDRPIPHTSAHFPHTFRTPQGARRRVRALPHTSARFRTLSAHVGSQGWGVSSRMDGVAWAKDLLSAFVLVQAVGLTFHAVCCNRAVNVGKQQCWSMFDKLLPCSRN